jgi:hypothetical protein
MTLAEQLEQFARERGGVMRHGRQPARPVLEHRDLAASTSQTIPERRDLADPWIEYTDDYTVWKQGR